MAQARTYIPPLRCRALTRLYDPVVRGTTRENTFQRVVSSLFFHHLDREAKRFLTVFGALSLYSGRRPA